MLGKTEISDTNLFWSKVFLYPSPSFLFKNQLAKEGPDSVAPVVIPPLAQTLDRSFKSDRSLFRLEHCATIWTGPQTSGRIRNGFDSFRKGFNKDTSPTSISSWIKQTVILYYELSDQKAHLLHQVKSSWCRAFAAPKGFQSGVPLDPFLSVYHWSHLIPSHCSIWRVWLELTQSFTNWAGFWLLNRTTSGP